MVRAASVILLSILPSNQSLAGQVPQLYGKAFCFVPSVNKSCLPILALLPVLTYPMDSRNCNMHSYHTPRLPPGSSFCSSWVICSFLGLCAGSSYVEVDLSRLTLIHRTDGHGIGASL